MSDAPVPTDEAEAPDDNARLKRELKRLILAKSDMDQVALAAEYLSKYGGDLNDKVERVMWTGIAVTYARPFGKSNKVGAVEGRMVRLDDAMQKSLHSRLLELRDQLFAHSDETELRGIVDAYELLGIGTGDYVEEYATLNAGALRDIMELADLFEERFAARIHEIQEQLGRRRDG